MKKPCIVDLTTDSQYVRQGITGWIHGWKKNGWRTADKKPVKNAELWQRLDAALKSHEVQWHWVKGHAGHAENERTLARDGQTALAVTVPDLPAAARASGPAAGRLTQPDSNPANRARRTNRSRPRPASGAAA